MFVSESNETGETNKQDWREIKRASERERLLMESRAPPEMRRLSCIIGLLAAVVGSDSS